MKYSIFKSYKTRQLFIGVISVLIFFIIINIYKTTNKIDIKEYPNKTIGTVTKYDIEQKHIYGKTYIYTHEITIEYQIDGKKYNFTNKYNGPKNKMCNENDNIEVLYNSSHPEKVVPKFLIEYQNTESDAYKNMMPCLLIICVVPLILVCIFNIKKMKIYNTN